jgi:hypothetical protein
MMNTRTPAWKWILKAETDKPPLLGALIERRVERLVQNATTVSGGLTGAHDRKKHCITNSKIRAGAVVQWQGTCLACTRPWVLSPTPQVGKKSSNSWLFYVCFAHSSADTEIPSSSTSQKALSFWLTLPSSPSTI